MYTFKDGDIHAYKTQARTITLIKGNSSVLYPFYTSSGLNSNSKETWFPWMGYLSFPAGEFTKGEVYMVKPVNWTVSKEAVDILHKYMVDKAFEYFIRERSDNAILKLIEEEFGFRDAIMFENGADDEEVIGFIKEHYQQVADSFIRRMGNDEALAISCSLGGGEWAKYPEMREEIMRANSTAKFIKPIESITYTENPIREMSEKEQNELIAFKGIACEGKVKRSHAEMATHMEGLILQESQRYVSSYFIQEKKDFPATEQVNDLVQVTHARELRDKYVGCVSNLIQMERRKEEANQPNDGMNPH
ncbi:hypothetical protein OQJ18_13645 [Fluoribacter dumoffii]|uniref:Uncharacterized protein n=1 Tax=Fluoribacter dumoffii TaxID=463 RepID=A0A377GDR1_9GAMM|nr:hypothetical protein [Fluoribacter dumoffii]KTC91238.1 hypothetical protein Ldum_2306 [Fluoribacter dumoffii NY 23]MCW8387595.1 hypothetical protein [Fluoribacter dumoffii]MCW8416860.1 hypothetical protein [Fluoribacter dumoffii]MCW8455300.1 hypothetical protein [Fluoribacter dumoffii]MCW8460622.1 hypothetical protein [Fluoribacter dumoffii]